MQDSVKLFVRICSEIMEFKGQVYEFGALQVPEQEGYSDLRPYFIGAHYTGCDMRPGPGVDRIEDLEKGLSFEDGSAQAVICMDTLEHVFDVFKAMSEMSRVVQQEGCLIISSVLNHEIHSYPYDYWRFTPECFVRLLSGFDLSLIGGLGNPVHPVSIFGVGVKTKNKAVWRETLDAISKRYSHECMVTLRYDKNLWRKTKLVVFRIFNNGKYLSKTMRIRTSWSIRDREDLSL
ncbi:MAG: methyltransferase domain-containing protein [Pseudomonadota bacterium]